MVCASSSMTALKCPMATEDTVWTSCVGVSVAEKRSVLRSSACAAVMQIVRLSSGRTNLNFCMATNSPDWLWISLKAALAAGVGAPERLGGSGFRGRASLTEIPRASWQRGEPVGAVMQSLRDHVDDIFLVLHRAADDQQVGIQGRLALRG